MDLRLKEEQKILLQSLGRFIKKEILPLEEKFREQDEAPWETRLEVRRRSKEVGFYGIHLPEEVGGGGMGVLDFVLMVEEINRHETYHFGADIYGGAGGPTAILLACTEEQKKKYLTPLMNIEKTTCFALTEPEAGSDATNLRTRAVKDGDVYVINGTKFYITGSPHADFAMVFALTDPEKKARGGITCFLVDMDTPGISVSVQDTIIRDGMAGEIHFEDVRVPAGNILGAVGYGFKHAMDWIAHGRLSIGATAAGVTERVMKKSLQYSKERVTFGKPLSERQAVQWMIADIATELECLRWMLYSTAWKVERGERCAAETSIVKLFGSEAVWRAVDAAVQIYGGMGLMRETGLERYLRKMRVLRIVEGTSEIQRRLIAREISSGGWVV
ncbi:MAG: acyl-CoA dehydrogenase family protein [bacterium]